MAIALLLNRVSRLGAARSSTAVLLFVWAVPSTVSTQVFYWLFSNQYGVVNYLLDQLPGVHMQGHDWFADPHQGLAVVTVVVVWGADPAAGDLAARRDHPDPARGARGGPRATAPAPWQAFRHVTLPFLRPLLVDPHDAVGHLGLRGLQPDLVHAQRPSRARLPDARASTCTRKGSAAATTTSGATIGVLMMVGLLGRHGLLHPAAVPDRGRRMTDRPPTRRRGESPAAGRPAPRTAAAGARRTRSHRAGTRSAMLLAVVLGFPIYWMLITRSRPARTSTSSCRSSGRTTPPCAASREVLQRPDLPRRPAQQPDHHAGRGARSASSSASSARWPSPGSASPAAGCSSSPC